MLGQEANDTNNNGNLFTCTICYEHAPPLRDPVLMGNLNCRHVFCRKEIEAVPKENGQIPCPSCRRLSDKVEPISADALIFRMFQSSVVACPKGCGWSGEVMNHEKHYQNCENFKCDDCGAVVMLPMEIEVCWIGLGGRGRPGFLILGPGPENRNTNETSVRRLSWIARTLLSAVKNESLAIIF